MTQYDPYQAFEPVPPTYPPGHQPAQNQPAHATTQLPAGPVWTPPPAPPRRRGGVLIAVAVVVIALVGAGVSYAAGLATADRAGARTPRGAVARLVSDLHDADLLGVLDHLPPAERDAMLDPVRDGIAQLKRTRVLTQAANPRNVSGVRVSVRGLRYGADVPINDHLTVVRLTGGTITVNVDLDRIPYTREFLQAAFPQHRPSGRHSETIDLAAAHPPVRIAAQKVDGKWYPSLIYTIVDNAVRVDDPNRAPTADDYIGAAGAGSAQDAARQVIVAAGHGDAGSVIRLLPPEEMAAVHDYGRLIIGRTNPSPDDDLVVNAVDFDASKVSGGTLVSVRSIDVTTHHGERYTYQVAGSCVRYTGPRGSGTFCADDAVRTALDHTRVSAAERAALTRLFATLPKIGVVATQSGGTWYIDPIRSFGDVSVTVLRGLQSGDVITLVRLLNRI